MSQTSEELTLHFGTRPHEIDAATLVTTLQAVEISVREIGAKLSHGPFRLHIRALNKGSFEIVGAILAAKQALEAVDWKTTREVLKTLVEVIKLGVELKGKTPKKVGEKDGVVEIKRSRKPPLQTPKTVYNIYANNVIVNNALAKGFDALQEDKQIKNLQIKDAKKQELLNVPRKSFPCVAKRTLKSGNSKSVQRLRTDLRVFKVVFGAGPKWVFYFRGNKIAATIADDKFMELVNESERFGKGDELNVDLEIHREFDPSVGTYVNKDYKVTHVYHHKPKDSQGLLPLGETDH